MNPTIVGYTLHYRVLFERFGYIPATITATEARAVSCEVARRRRSGEPTEWHLQP